MTILSCLSTRAATKSFSIRVPFTLDRGLIKIRCITDTGRQRVCAIDTGATRTVAAPSAATVPAGSVQVVLWTASGSAGAEIVTSSITIAGQKFPVTMIVLQRDFGIGCDVLIGQDILSQFDSVTVDYKTRIVTFNKR